MTLNQIITYTALTILAALWIAELLARRQADQHAALLRAHLDDAIGVQVDQYEENQRLLASLRQAVDERNAANLRAARAVNSLRALPALTVRCPLPDKEAGIVPFNLN